MYMEIHEKKTVSDGITRHEVEATGHVATKDDVADYKAAKSNQAVWYLIGLIEALLGLRILFGLFGANQVGFTDFLYTITSPFVAPFRGIFAAPAVGGSYFDSAALLAMVIIALLGWGIAALVDLGNPKSV
jgi:uncharacterized protein YggT (Ycf19 family)